jgi:glycosyltransferase 2 family protein
LGLLISVGAAAVIASAVDLGAVVQVLRRATLGPLALAAAVIGLQTVILAVRWRWLLPSRLDGTPVPLAITLRVLIVGTLINIGLPGRVGDAARALLVRRAAGVSAMSSLGSIVVERGLDVAALGLAGYIAGMLVGGPALVVQISALLAVGAVAGLALLWSGLLSRTVVLFDRRLAESRLAEAIGPIARLVAGVEMARTRGHLVRAAIVTVASVLLDGVIVWLAASSLGVTMAPLEALLVGVAAVLITAIPSAPANVGTFELAATYVMAASGQRADAALAVAIVAHALIVVPLGVAALVILAFDAARIDPADGLEPAASPDPRPPTTG